MNNRRNRIAHHLANLIIEIIADQEYKDNLEKTYRIGVAMLEREARKAKYYGDE